MNRPGGVLMGRADLERAFTSLGERLARRGVVADLFVVGGAAMAMAYDATRVTRDVDAMFVPQAWFWRKHAPWPTSLAYRRGGSTSRPAFMCLARTIQARGACSTTRTRVMAASPHHIFAMKALSGRTRDVDDLRRLAELAGVSSVEDALQMCSDFYPDEPVSQRSFGVLREMFG